MDFTRSKELFKQANQVMVGGVNSPVRAFKGVGGDPFFVASGAGARIMDVDGNEYVDYVLSWGPLVLGHAHPRVVEAVSDAMKRGSSFGIPTEAEVRLAERIIELVPSIEKVRLVNSGTEASMSAIRLARGYTKRDLVVKVEGCYHGHVDGLLVKAGSGLTTLGVPTSPGIPEAYASCTLTIPFNDIEAARAVFEKRGDSIACIVVEPVAGNMGVIPPEPNYLNGLRKLADKYGSLLIFDEVMTGFRVALGGAQSHYNVLPDLTILGKVIGGGLPVGAYGGPHAIMDHVSPTGPVYQAGTLSGNPLATAAGLATLEVLSEPGTVPKIRRFPGQTGPRSRCIGNGSGRSRVSDAGWLHGLYLLPGWSGHQLRRGDRLRYGTLCKVFLGNARTRGVLGAVPIRSRLHEFSPYGSGFGPDPHRSQRDLCDLVEICVRSGPGP